MINSMIPENKKLELWEFRKKFLEIRAPKQIYGKNILVLGPGGFFIPLSIGLGDNFLFKIFAIFAGTIFFMSIVVFRSTFDAKKNAHNRYPSRYYKTLMIWENTFEFLLALLFLIGNIFYFQLSGIDILQAEFLITYVVLILGFIVLSYTRFPHRLFKDSDFYSEELTKKNVKVYWRLFGLGMLLLLFFRLFPDFEFSVQFFSKLEPTALFAGIVCGIIGLIMLTGSIFHFYRDYLFVRWGYIT